MTGRLGLAHEGIDLLIEHCKESIGVVSPCLPYGSRDVEGSAREPEVREEPVVNGLRSCVESRTKGLATHLRLHAHLIRGSLAVLNTVCLSCPQLLSRDPQLSEGETSGALHIQHLLNDAIVVRVEEGPVQEVAQRFVLNDGGIEPKPRRILIRYDPSIGISAFAANPARYQLLIVDVELAEVIPLLFVVEADVRHYEALIVGVAGIIRNHRPHDAANELDVWRKGPIRAEDCSNAERWVVKALSEHRHLNDAVELATPELGEHSVLPIIRHRAMDCRSLKTHLLEDCPHLIGMVDRHRRCSDLVRKACRRPEEVELL